MNTLYLPPALPCGHSLPNTALCGFYEPKSCFSFLAWKEGEHLFHHHDLTEKLDCQGIGWPWLGVEREECEVWPTHGDISKYTFS